MAGSSIFYMKILSPTLRENKRYLFVVGENLAETIPKSIADFSGTLGLSQARIQFIESQQKSAIIAINREALTLVRASFCISKERIVVKRVSGTLSGLRTKEKLRSKSHRKP